MVKRILAVFILGLLALGVQGGLAMVMPRSLCPDLGLLVVLAIGLHWLEVTPGMFVASALGFAADLLSSAIFGAHALLRVLAFSLTSLARSQMDLRGGAIFALFAGAITILNALGLMLLLRFFTSGEAGAAAFSVWGVFSGVLPHAAINACLAPAVSAVVVWVCDRVEGEASRPGIEFEARRPTT
ncbi:MAG: hypothetical protein QF570_20200 [Myxococcota bacterium]|nr:hypothetical protein [Myxococcota bacterium]